MRYAAVLAAVVLVMSCIGFWWMSPPRQPAALRGSLHPTVDHRTTEQLPEVAASTPPAPGVKRVRSAETTAPSATHDSEDAPLVSEPSADPATAGSERIPIEGTLVVIDSQGEKHASEDGSFMLSAWSKLTGVELIPVEVVKGCWSAQAPTPHDYSIHDLVMGGRAAVSDERGSVEIPKSRRIELRAHWLENPRFHVVDADTGAQLSNVSVVTRQDPLQDEDEHPGLESDYRTILDGQQSPFELEVDPQRYSNVYWIGAPGYAWRRVKLDPTRGGERSITLELAGELIIELAGAPPEPGTRLRLIQAPLNGFLDDAGEAQMNQMLKDSGIEGVIDEWSRYAIFETRIGDGTVVVVSGVRPGRYGLVAAIGRPHENLIRLGTAPVEVIRGRTTRVRLELREAPRAPDPVEVIGTLVLPEAWGSFAPVSISLDPLDDGLSARQDSVYVEGSDIRAIPASNGGFSWSVASILPGRYRVHVEPLGFQELVDLPERPTVEVALLVPEPGELRVELVAEHSGERIERGSVGWHAQMGPSITSHTVTQATRDAESGFFIIRAPVGAITIFADGNGYADQQHELVLGPGIENLRLELRQSWGFRIHLVDHEGHPIDGGHFRTEIESVDGLGADAGSSSSTDFLFTAYVTAPGVYRVELGRIPGYAPTPPQEVTVPDEGLGEITFQLTPSK